MDCETTKLGLPLAARADTLEQRVRRLLQWSSGGVALMDEPSVLTRWLPRGLGALTLAGCLAAGVYAAPPDAAEPPAAEAAPAAESAGESKPAESAADPMTPEVERAEKDLLAAEAGAEERRQELLAQRRTNDGPTELLRRAELNDQAARLEVDQAKLILKRAELRAAAIGIGLDDEDIPELYPRSLNKSMRMAEEATLLRIARARDRFERVDAALAKARLADRDGRADKETLRSLKAARDQAYGKWWEVAKGHIELPSDFQPSELRPVDVREQREALNAELQKAFAARDLARGDYGRAQLQSERKDVPAERLTAAREALADAEERLRVLTERFRTLADSLDRDLFEKAKPQVEPIWIDGLNASLQTRGCERDREAHRQEHAVRRGTAGERAEQPEGAGTGRHHCRRRWTCGDYGCRVAGVAAHQHAAYGGAGQTVCAERGYS